MAVPQAALQSLLGNDADKPVLQQAYFNPAAQQAMAQQQQPQMDSATAELLAMLGIFNPANVTEGYRMLIQRALGR